MPGRPATLTDDQLARPRDILASKDPRQLQFDFGLWTRDMIAIVVEREFGVRLHRTTIGRILRQLGFSPQRPLRRAWQQDREAVRRCTPPAPGTDPTCSRRSPRPAHCDS
ncbi:MAG TPA: winged helix-turn-helix domain-containing protein [Mycobacterium sp.]|nr:winged helix-turn-helix domain-containing protein [Mycobacterium sp.]HUH70491.1 winged helix-turn-helix domain-containing protein [Mycobacterium sp.]